jgi:DeoR family glycerol-3-phosphate regulon repressor/DeoR family fructose operon transcriptional repressor
VNTSDGHATIPTRRQQQLMELLAARGHLTVDELAEHFGVSDDTVRRDLQLLEQRKRVLRTHGGAVAAGFLAHRETAFSHRCESRAAAKSRIGKAAAELISDGETLVVNSGSTTFAFATSLGIRRNLTIVTNNLAIPPVLMREAVQEIHIIGGLYRVNLASTIGSLARGTGGISVDTAVLGVSGLNAQKGISTSVLGEASMFAEMIASAERTIVLADATKFGRNAFAHIAPLAAVNVLVTDAPPPDDLARALGEANVEIVVAPG